ncbi:hypothetical protein ACH9DO_16470 [Kocuria sp. M1N1S27]|uniref:hypothetical protein n=1 Tax=Kocuria kalidii TaxID=3376283 RepID=UPI00379C79F5
MVKIGILADLGLPEKIGRTVAPALSRELSKAAAGESPWEVEVSQETLPLNRDGDIPLLEHACALRNKHGWDYVVYLTDLPRSHAGDPMTCETNAGAGAVLVSLPVLGALRLTAKVQRLLTSAITAVHQQTTGRPAASVDHHAPQYATTRRVSSDDGEDTTYLVHPGRANRWRLLGGMVRSNRPGRLLPALSSCIAAAVATGAFGIFYAAIWNMSDALPPVRLAMISLVVVAALSGWLILHNGLWDKPREATEPWRAHADNTATVITVGLSVAAMYHTLWATLFLIGLAVIEADYLQSQLGHPVGLSDYVRLSWLAASLGTLAGALGSNFDNDAAIRAATYSRREQQRRELADSYA